MCINHLQAVAVCDANATRGDRLLHTFSTQLIAATHRTSVAYPRPRQRDHGGCSAEKEDPKRQERPLPCHQNMGFKRIELIWKCKVAQFC